MRVREKLALNLPKARKIPSSSGHTAKSGSKSDNSDELLPNSPHTCRSQSCPGTIQKAISEHPNTPMALTNGV